MTNLPRVLANLTTYDPTSKSRLEGGPQDRYSHPVVPLELVLSAWVPRASDERLFGLPVVPRHLRVTLAVDMRYIRAHSIILIPVIRLVRKGSKVVHGPITLYVHGEALDTGGNFGVHRRVVRHEGYEPIDVAWARRGDLRPASDRNSVFIVRSGKGGHDGPST